MSERRMAALAGEGEQQHSESPGRRTRISRAHLTGSLHGHQSTENPILLVSFISKLAKHHTYLSAKDRDKKVTRKPIPAQLCLPGSSGADPR